MTRLPHTRPIWCVQHITSNGPTTDYHDTEQAATNQWTHLTSSRTAAVMYLSNIIEERPEENAA